MGVAFKWPYRVRDNPIDLFLTAGEYQSTFLKDEGIAPERIVTIGSIRYEHVAEWKRTRSQRASRQAIGVPEGYALYVLWDPSVAVRGFVSVQEQYRVLSTLMELTVTRQCALIIKPHPSHTIGALEQWVSASPSRHVFLVPAQDLAYDAINASDVVVTKMSAIALEAMLLERPVISPILDGERQWRRLFDDAVECVTSPEALARLLEEICADPVRRAAWTGERLAQQSQFVKQYFDRGVELPTANAVRAIAARLSAEALTEVAV